MIGSRSFFALMRKNFIVRKRNWFGTLLEIGLPVFFVGILVLIKVQLQGTEGFKPEFKDVEVPTTQRSLMPQSFQDYVNVIISQRRCIPDNTDGRITGFPTGNPFMKCSANQCPRGGNKENPEDWIDADSFCEYYIFAIAPDDPADTMSVERSLSLQQYVVDLYPNITTQFPRRTDYSFVRVFESAAAMEEYIGRDDYGLTNTVPKIGMGLVFQTSSDEKDFSYKIRQNSTWFDDPKSASRPTAPTTPDTTRLFDDFAREDSTCEGDQESVLVGIAFNSCTAQYGHNGVLTVQRLVHDWIFSVTGAKDTGNYVAQHGVSFLPFPTPAFVQDGFYDTIEQFMPLVVTIGLLYPFSSMIRAITLEKSLRLKELMKMMSVTETDINHSWFISFFLIHIITSTLMAIMVDLLFTSSQFGILWFFCTFTIIACIVFAMFISSLLTRPTRATLVGLLIFFCGYFLTLSTSYNTGNAGTISLVSIHPVAAFSYGLQEIGRLEGSGPGVTLDTISKSDNPSGFTFITSMQSLIFDMIFWGILSWYFNRIARSDYGQPLPWYFPILGSYWCPGTGGRGDFDPDGEDGEDNLNDEIPVEPVPDSVHAQIAEGKGIQIKNLRKQFGEKTAVDGLNLSMYSGQITALLGHNGAGKTTTISMLTGLFSPTDGTASVGGKDIRTQMKYIRQEIGICFQHDCLFPQLTVQEHIEFFARLKGMYTRCTREEAREKVKQAIEDVALYEKRNTLSKSLSGGMKRKLSVAIAFCGDSKTVLLDEPTSGMDPFSRRFTWNVIRQYREDRCIILTTHFMDEADILGDRIAIMAEGQLRCAGSSLFLKKHYGVGYQLSIEKNPTNIVIEGSGGKSPRAIEHSIQDIVKGSVAEASLLSNVGTEMSFQLPIGAASNFTTIFEQLDDQVEQNNIVTYGVSITTLDEVFLLVARGETNQKEVELASKSQLKIGDGEDDAGDNTDDERSVRTRMNLEQDGLFFRHLSALFVKRAIAFKRDKKAWLCSTVLPAIFVLLGLIIFKFAAPSRDFSALALDYSKFNEDVTSVPRNPVTFNSGGQFKAQNYGSCLAGSGFEEYFDYNSDTEGYYGSYDGGQRFSLCGGGRQSNFFGNEFTAPEGVNSSEWCLTEDGIWGAVCGVSASIMESESIMDQFSQAGSVPIGVDNVESMYFMGVSVNQSKDDYTASQYGAISFTHDTLSQVTNGGDTFNGTSYEDYAVNRCLNEISNPAAGSDYTFLNEEQCERYRGIGYVVHYNFTAVHVGPLLQTLADEAIAKRHDPEIKISATIHPMPITALERSYGDAQDAFMAWFLLVLSFPFITGSFATFVVNEAQSKARHLQTVSGVKPEAYWLSSFCWDWMNYQLPCWIVVILFFIFQVDAFTTTEGDVLAGTIVSLVLFGPAAIGFTYVLTFFFKSPSLCNLFVIIFNFLIGMAGPLVAFILRIIASSIEAEEAGRNDDSFSPSTLPQTADIVEWCLRIFPAFNLGNALFKMVNISSLEFFQGKKLNVFDGPVALYDTIMQLVLSVVYIFLTICIERLSTKPAVVTVWNNFLNFVVCKCIWGAKSQSSIIEAVLEDDDVRAEEERVSRGDANDDLIVLNKLTKQYDGGKIAVNNVSYGIPPGQCFGLLGINGAGKTTSMAMLTAEFPPTAGDATLGGYSVVSQPEKTRRRIGYCPQFDAHFVGLTGREHVTLYANIKGIPREEVSQAVVDKLREVGLSESDSDRLSAGYSGGMKRKLSVACATIGQPQIVFLDEPSTGMDPVARRDMWKVISDMVSGTGLPPRERTSVILTTHSMLECESLCPRIAIMANGTLRCLGSAQHLKTKFGQGYQVEMKVLSVEQDDEDYKTVLAKIIEHSGIAREEDEEAGANYQQLTLKLDGARNALRALTADDSIADKVHPEGQGQIIYRHAASGVGVAMYELASFACEELRMMELNNFLNESFGQDNYSLRERQDNKARYEITSVGIKISTIFKEIESKKDRLRLADYGVSQTSLEQVFNMHAAEAEKLKHGGDDR
mmetsp:Transcript_19452/g.28094  ORF Transcript_19452/g.28094 Transcript_19452/m.28094 type:complete len:2009 (+) Transcript_19452:240-6266(+)|eukprot:CAMPEP_0202445108 /NCGR_PEP_ID=MMETSP1360-20130828/3985_1 /ASSEMBLY_ACC=CAM_ASM_000848 /TAXON_ID=515479 /ORGANISM="Licmophora paradoxa, Strain CCMP2313" /LENGTH=2008 /DNA_ID=CAMNT_0049061267 /DNA_START=255 /DNA_END=6281 /DNA_ORIENTATION=+